MAQVRELLGAHGFTGVATHLQSGNILFDDGGRTAAQNADLVEGLLSERFGFPIETLVRTADQLAAILDRDPFGGRVEDPARYLVAFLSERPVPAAVKELAAADYGAELMDLSEAEEEAYLYCAGGVHVSKLAARITPKRLGVRIVTSRNWRVVQALYDKAIS